MGNIIEQRKNNLPRQEQKGKVLNANDDLFVKLESAKKSLDNGLITQEKFDKYKENLLNK